MPKQFTLSKHERLKSRKQIELLFKAGKSFSIAFYKIYYHSRPVISSGIETTNLQFGTGVSSKHFKRAVDRNRIKRLTREAYRLQKNLVQEKIKEKNIHLDIFFIYTDRKLPEYKNVYETISLILNRVTEIITKQ